MNCKPLFSVNSIKELMYGNYNPICFSDRVMAFILLIIVGIICGIITSICFGTKSIIACILLAISAFIIIDIAARQRQQYKKAQAPQPPLQEGYTGMKTTTEPDCSIPNARNPFMNVLLDEIKYNPTRPDAANVMDPVIKQSLDDYFRIQWFSDPTDVFGRNQNQRQFIVQPSTSIPNDQKSFQEWLYLISGKTCKEGGREACLSGTDGSPVVWLNQDN